MQYHDLAGYITARAHQLGHNSVSLSEALGFGRSYINSLINDQFKPSVKRCREIAGFFGDDPGIILTLAGYQEPLEKEDPIITGLVQAAAGLPKRTRQDLLNYATYLKTRASSLAALREKRSPYEGGIIGVELPGGESLEIPVSPEVAALPAETIKDRIVTALASDPE